jgi:hypothetical protein
MATVNNIFFKGVRGKLGNVVFFTRNGKTFMRMASEGGRKRKPTPQQNKITSKFSEAVKYARAVLETPELKKLYTARDYKSRGVYQLAFRDAFHAPEVSAINIERYHGLAGDEVPICATDNFKVKSVLVTIIDAEGNVLEQGEAVESFGISWLYESTIDNAAPKGCTVRATARDLPGNEGSLELVI